MKEYLTIKEFAEVTGLTTQAIYKRLTTDLQPFCKLIDNKKMLNFKALQIFDILDFKPVDNQAINELPTNKQPVANQQIIEILNKTIDLLTEQLQTKDEQLANKEETIQKLIQLQHNNQVLQLEAKKPSFFEKIFRKKLDA